MKFSFNIFLENRFFYIFAGLIGLYVTGYFIPFLIPFVHLGLWILLLGVFVEMILLYSRKSAISASRLVPEKMSNGDVNRIQLSVFNLYGFVINGTVLDEAPYVFQLRSNQLSFKAGPGETVRCDYLLNPVQRGRFAFGAVNIFVHSPLGLVNRHFRIELKDYADVFPSLIQMHKYGFMALAAKQATPGLKKVRRIGHTMEFDQIRDYVRGDDYRTINWKATARRQKLMRNQYQDERSQDIYCVIDSGRNMKMPFKQLSLLDYAINASLALANIIIRKDDKAGLITFDHKPGVALPASNRPGQLNKILHRLYDIQTDFLETDFEKLYALLNRQIKHRSLLMLLTNFESLSALKRQLPILRKINQRHLLVVIFFRNDAMEALIRPAKHARDIYLKTMAEKMIFEKQRISAELSRYGIQNMRLLPQELTVASINRYLKIKSQRSL